MYRVHKEELAPNASLAACSAITEKGQEKLPHYGTQGESLLITGKILGRANASTTARYAHLADDPLKAAAQKTAASAAAALAGKSAEVIPFNSGRG